MDAQAQDLAQKYQKKTDKQHVLDNPDTYTGSMEMTEYDTFIYDNDSNKIVAKLIQIIPGLYKLFDEASVNASDHSKRMHQLSTTGTDVNQVTYINFNIESDGTISVENDGNGIDIAKHPEEDIWIPEMIFAHLRTSTNYNKDEKKIVGGKNGFGVKLVFIWSSWAKVETIDHSRKLLYSQEFENNLNVIKPPSVTKCTKKPYTKITFKPDFKRLGIDGFSPDMLALLKRRIYDIAAITDKSIKVRFNGELVPVKHFQQYVDMYIGSKDDASRVYEEANDRWEYVVALAPKEEFTQVSFVNGIFTGKGGKHVDYIVNQIVRKLTAFIKQKKKVDVKPNTIKEQLMLFVRCDIENPSFDSQTKDYMTTPVSSFGSSCEVSDKFIEKIAKMGVMEAACALTEVKENKAAKKTDGTKSKNVRGIPKLTDANFAGTNKSSECILILCEGDSAKSGVISGLSSEDRNTIGVYPMRGKMFNVRGEAITRIMENKEISEIKQILGLETGKKYDLDSVKKDLRYGKVVFMTDQDLDGSHIKGLGINLFDSQWETLTQIPGFLGFMNTPIIKARKGKEQIMFYNDGQYKQWKDTNSHAKGWTIKYYKGLGTSDAKEFKEYFKNKKMVEFTSTGEESKDAIDKAFNKKRSDDRKTWLEQYNRELYLDTNKKEVSYQEFINNELIHFSIYDCERSIPNLVDGNKTSQRKVLYTAFKRNQTKEVKVAQFSAATAELSHYHHGEDSLNQTIVNMAQNFVGSNNINVLTPIGQFGTRLQGGEDSASPRYITTKLNKLTRLIFPEADDKVLQYLEDDGYPVEPMYYVPIIPMILVNGSKGIGTGFSTDIMCYNPIELIDYMKSSLSGNIASMESMTINPYYQGFKGEISKINDSKYLIKGCYKVLNDKQVQISELPIGTWTEDYKNFLEELLQFEYNEEDADGKKKRRGSVSSISSDTKKAAAKAKTAKDKTSSKTATLPPPKPKGSCPVKDYVDMSTDVVVDFTITFAPGFIKKLLEQKGEHGCNGLEKFLKLYTTKTNTNMHMFDEHEKLVKYSNVKEVIDHFMRVRFKTYETRKAYQVEALAKELMVLSNKARFITEILEETIDLRKKKSDVISQMLKDKNYDIIDDDPTYKYLVKMPMDSVSEENVKRILNEREKKQAELDELKGTTEKQIWLNELDKLKLEYSNVEPDDEEENEEHETSDEEKKAPAKKVVKKVVTKKKIKVVEGNQGSL